MELDLFTIGSLAKVRSRRKIKPYRVIVKSTRSGVEFTTVLTVHTNGWKRAERCASLKVERVGMRVLSAKLYEQAYRDAVMRRVPAAQSPPRIKTKAKPVENGGGGARTARTGAKSTKAKERAARALERLQKALAEL